MNISSNSNTDRAWEWSNRLTKMALSNEEKRKKKVKLMKKAEKNKAIWNNEFLNFII